ncbi:imv protein [Pteropox virus]|uniref:Imv protein n=1 Tax=Pteropox virus TaxID=1873698 RepID=A0A1B1MRH3_9POXV|nr:imv protein [Pteropox virus]ANS71135.1 imv protein [Pteropox virus]
MNKYDIASIIAVTFLALIMVISGSVLLFKLVAPTRLVSFISPAKARFMYFMEVLAVNLFVPGTIALYVNYMNALFKK